MAQAFLTGSFQTANIPHRLLTGLDLSTKAYFADWGQYHLLDTANAAFNSHDPDYGVPVNGYPQFNYQTPLEQRAKAIGGQMEQRYSAFYVQDEAGFFQNTLRLTMAARYTFVTQAEWGGEPYSAKRMTPRFALSANLHPTCAVYALYDEAFLPQAGKLASGAKVQPITGHNMEIGIKKEWMKGKWNTTLALYRIVKNNELTADPFSPPNSGLSIELGQKTAKGIELDLRGQIWPGLHLIANYAFTDSRVNRVNEGVTGIVAGDAVPNFARHTANTWLSYRIPKGSLRGIGFSFGCSALLGRVMYWDISPDPTQSLPDYYKLDGVFFWEKQNIRLAINMFNMADTYLYSGSYYAWLKAYNWQTEPGRNLRFSVHYSF